MNNKNGNWSNYFWLRSTGFAFENIENIGIFENDYLLEEINKLKNFTVTVSGKELQKIEKEIVLKKEEFNQKYLLEMKVQKKYFLSLIQKEAFKEALYLSNPEALLRIESLARDGIDTINSRKRQRIKLAWSYIQRFCTKNDTVSFFGPIVWGSFNNKSSKEITCKPVDSNKDWIVKKNIKFEYWVVSRLISVISEDLQNDTPLKLNNGCSLLKNTLYYPLNKSKKLSLLQNEIIEIINYSKDISYSDLILIFLNKGYDKKQIIKVLDVFLLKKVLIRTFNIPSNLECPLFDLSSKINKITNKYNNIKIKKWLGMINDLEGFRNSFEKAELTERKSIIEKIYKLLNKADIDTDRSKGSMYIGRYPIYEDCLRNVKIELSHNISKNIQNDLEPIMSLYSSLVDEVSKKIHQKYLYCWKEISIESSNNDIDFLSFISNLQKEINTNTIIAELRELIRKSWLNIVGSNDSNSDIELTSKHINKLITLISTPNVDNLNIKHFSSGTHSPDFMISSKSVEDINKGNYEIVIGEIHPAVHTVSQPVAQPFCPYQAEIKEEIKNIKRGKVTIVADSAQSYQRSHIDWINFPNLNRIILPSGVFDENSNSVRSGSCFIVNENGNLLVKSKEDADISENLLTVIPTHLHQVCFALANDIIGKNINSRIRYKNIVVKRKSWIINGSELPLENKIIDNSENFLKWQHWKEGNSMPRYVFVKNPSEQKPIFVDFYNPFSLELLSYMSNKNEDMFFTEMYPDAKNLWLNDENGRYCSEFRTSYVN